MHQSRFADIARLPLSEQRRLLNDGDAPERLWAAWAIALELGSGALPMLVSVERGSIPDGLHRHLLVVLAGLGERRLLRTIADAEPSATVRATAASLYLRTAPDRTSPEITRFAVEQLRTAPSDVRIAVLNEASIERIAIPLTEVLRCLRDPDSSVRRACIGCMARNPTLGQQRESIRALAEALADESDGDLRRLVVAALPRASLLDVLETLARDRPNALGESLRSIHAQFGALAWLEVKSIARTTNLEHLLTILQAEVRPEPPDGLSWLCQVLELVNENTGRAAQEVRRRVLCLIQSQLTAESVASLDRSHSDLLRTVFSKTLRELKDYLEEYGPDSSEPYMSEIEHVLTLFA